ncbi:hypothetical protein PUR34_21750 [Streptomyces sp. JV185]|uniref:hypothetical protein n=1 Tax=Streptomyces sp. JV185 TaxID=858638 RepID=UPI002E797CB4|nr:hypothetical protein [Streptomyces sp. JV185]MEE1770686.1 hypothetical protein [Streptomyces sp. JV185]
MAGNSPVLGLGRTLVDGDRVADTAALLTGGGGVFERRIVRRRRRWETSSFFSTPRAWMNKLLQIVS